MTRVLAAYPISDEDTRALPVCDLAAGIEFYEQKLGFSLIERHASSALLARDSVRIGLIHDRRHEPGRAGSIALEVEDIDSVRQELEDSGAHPGVLGMDEWSGKKHRTCFVREDRNGYCFCFFCPAAF